MIYTIENTVKMAHPIRVWDAEGEEICRAHYIDTDTGEVRYRMDTLNASGTNLDVRSEIRPVPFRIEVQPV